MGDEKMWKIRWSWERENWECLVWGWRDERAGVGVVREMKIHERWEGKEASDEKWETIRGWKWLDCYGTEEPRVEDERKDDEKDGEQEEKEETKKVEVSNGKEKPKKETEKNKKESNIPNGKKDSETKTTAKNESKSSKANHKHKPKNKNMLE